ncbi:MAG: alanine racemase, partial [Candidatus Taylorbacteria bacterium]|nr:alanine racemase [Candidatus Taylorbacteria bacterium]
MRRLLYWLSRKRFPYEPLISVTISKQRLLHNLNEFRKLIPHGVIAPVLKSNAYGHGLLEIANILKNDPKIPFFVVDSYFEAVALRARGIKKPLLVIGYTRPRTIIESELRNTAFTITSIDTLKALRDVNSTIYVHLKIDTGMRRQGILIEEVPYAKEILEKNQLISLQGICTHLCDADNPDETFTEIQTDHWNKVVAEFKNAFPHIWYFHAAATDGSRLSEDIHANVVRLGIGLYGLTGNEDLNKTLDLLPVLEMTTIITGMKMLLRGETVGYGNTFKAEDDLCIATIP